MTDEDSLDPRKRRTYAAVVFTNGPSEFGKFNEICLGDSLSTGYWQGTEKIEGTFGDKLGMFQDKAFKENIYCMNIFKNANEFYDVSKVASERDGEMIYVVPIGVVTALVTIIGIWIMIKKL